MEHTSSSLTTRADILAVQGASFERALYDSHQRAAQLRDEVGSLSSELHACHTKVQALERENSLLEELKVQIETECETFKTQHVSMQAQLDSLLMVGEQRAADVSNLRHQLSCTLQMAHQESSEHW